MRIADLLDYAVNRRGLVRKVLTLEEGRSLTTLCDPLTGRPVMVFKEDHYPAMEEREAGNAGECKPDLDQDAGAPSLLIDIRCVKGFDAPGESFAYCYFLTEPMYPHEDSGWNCAIARYAEAAVPQYERDFAASASAFSAYAHCGHWERIFSASVITSRAFPLFIMDDDFIRRIIPLMSLDNFATKFPFPYFLN